MMLKRGFGGMMLLLLIVACVILWPLYQLFGGARDVEGTEGHLLFQVTALQMELLHKGIQEASAEPVAEELAALKERVFSASYAHEKLTLAVGKESLNELISLRRLSDWIIRVQLAERELSTEESAVLKECHERFTPLFEEYTELFNETGQLYSVRSERLDEEDREIADWLEEQLGL
ncbi:hypothetical protein SY83_13740 [Paenibacillus swuensis]|uniref:Uncharacterized protein n=1 Tax=Paenibacillus swuensis TaxID=1178515 RepID=A0A172TJG7_9BACL|nr:hypothetical protein [Paenibacillus swuensis]ANE47150.1 hypothetical protein SY83_13740 [Paenibacillus swuensis]